MANVRTLEEARQLPEVPANEPEAEIEFEPGSVQRFKALDGRTMVVVAARGGLAAKEAPARAPQGEFIDAPDMRPEVERSQENIVSRPGEMTQ